MVEEGEMPDWLKELRDEQFGEEPEAEGEPAPEMEPEDPSARQRKAREAVEVFSTESEPEPEPEPEDEDVMDSLREQMREEERKEEEETEDRTLLPSFIVELEPWQRFVLALMLFLNVALCGCMALTMLGRIGLPF